jgi:thiamine phosphate synthase YjbQ (UPF0047 family)
MTKAKLPRPEPVAAAVTTAKNVAATTATVTNGAVATVSVTKTAAVANTEANATSAADIQLLNEKIAKMQAEIDGLKKQLTQVVTFIKQKIK